MAPPITLDIMTFLLGRRGSCAAVFSPRLSLDPASNKARKLRSFPRTRESRAKTWVPAFAGTNGVSDSKACRVGKGAALDVTTQDRRRWRRAHAKSSREQNARGRG